MLPDKIQSFSHSFPSLKFPFLFALYPVQTIFFFLFIWCSQFWCHLRHKNSFTEIDTLWVISKQNLKNLTFTLKWIHKNVARIKLLLVMQRRQLMHSKFLTSSPWHSLCMKMQLFVILLNVWILAMLGVFFILKVCRILMVHSKAEYFYLVCIWACLFWRSEAYFAIEIQRVNFQWSSLLVSFKYERLINFCICVHCRGNG